MGEMGLMVKDWEIYPSDLKGKGFIGRIMWDIAFCQPDGCRNKAAYLELLEATAEEIVERLREKDNAEH